MSANNDKIASLKMKLKSVTKMKLCIDTELLKHRHKERSLSEELLSIKYEKDYLKEQLEILRNQISQTTHQISMIEVCTTSEKSKIDTHVKVLNQHSEGFQVLFDKERNEHELRMKEQSDREAQYQQLMRQKEKEIAEKNEQQAREAAAIEEECDVIDRECAVLKKRNNAIMLKLRKKLLETENIRRNLMKRNPSEIEFV